jgi:lipoyl(octanoyl) transferase
MNLVSEIKQVLKMESSDIVFEDLGVIDYKKAWDYQEKLLEEVITKKKEYRNDPTVQIPGYILFCEHPHVYTLGKSGQANNLLINDEFLKSINATYYKIDRGGDITYHGPGQIVGYPVIDLEQFNIGVKEYIHKLEESIINTLAGYGIVSERLDGATGVWIDTKIPGKTRKICAIGVRVSRYVTMHGFAFNVNTNLGYFNNINPCGFLDKGVTSMQKELGKEQDFAEVKEKLLDNLLTEFKIKLNQDKHK